MRKFVNLSGSDLCLQQFDKFLKCSACNHWKRKLCKSVEIGFGKILDQVNLFLAGFSHLKPLCGSGGGPAGDSGGLGGQQISMPTKLTQLRYSGYSAEFLDRVEPNGNIPGKNGTAGIAGMY